MEQVAYKSTAIFKNEMYQHFGIHPVTCSLYGHSSEEIVDIEILIAQNQVRDKEVERGQMKSKEADYWGWFDSKKKVFTMIYPQYFLLDMCFPSGIKSTEEFGEGKAYRLIVSKLE